MAEEKTLDDVFHGIAQLMTDVPTIMEQLGGHFERMIIARAEALLPDNVAANADEAKELRDLAVESCLHMFAIALRDIRQQADMSIKLNSARQSLSHAMATMAATVNVLAAKTKSGFEQ